MKVYGLGILGCGDFTRIQSPVLQQSRRIRVAAVYDPNEAAARTAAERFGARVMGSAEALIGDATVEIVVVYTPPFTHRELVAITRLPAATAFSTSSRWVKEIGRAHV